MGSCLVSIVSGKSRGSCREQDPAWVGIAWGLQQSQRIVVRKILVTSHQSTKKSKESLIGAYRAESTLQYTAGSGITTTIPPLFLMGQHPGLNTRSWSKTGWTLQCSKKQNVDQHWRVDLSETQKCTKDYLTENLWEQPMESSISGIRSDSTSSKGAQSVFLWRFSQFNRARRGSLEMVMWIGRFSLSLKHLRDAWMDNLPMSALSEEQRRSQYLADVAQENAERELWGETVLDPNTPENRERWNTAQVNNHESLFPFSDNLITLMFIVASDLTEAQRETDKFPFS